MLARVFRRNFSSGALLTWGETTLGWGRPTNSQFLVPGAVEGGQKVVGAAAGQYHLGFVTSDHSVYTTGLNDCGQLGQTAGEDTPQKVPLEAQARCLACGARHSLALTHDGAVYSWGHAGTTGREGDAHLPGLIPQESFGNQPVTSIAAGNDFSLALTQQGQVYSWGDGFRYVNTHAATTSSSGTPPTPPPSLNPSSTSSPKTTPQSGKSQPPPTPSCSSSTTDASTASATAGQASSAPEPTP